MYGARRDGWPSAQEQQAKLANMLREQFYLDALPAFSMIVEGTTDRSYILKAVELFEQEHSINLLDIPKSVSGDAHGRIAVCAPGKPGAANRGGTPQLVRLAEALRPYVFTLEIFSGLVFVFDHDEEGLRAQDQIAKSGYEKDRNSITLDPRQHPRACAQKQVVIEDLLSLSIQQQFFNVGTAWCWSEFEAGTLKRFKWGGQSKIELRDFVCSNATLADLEEIGRLVLRVRAIFGLPTSAVEPAPSR